jgi:cobalt-zinc-cadmium resistance protein CzcA
LRLPLDALPDIVSLEMEVNTQVDAFSPEEVEKEVTVPLERALAGLPGLLEMRSTSQFGLSQIELIFEDCTPIVETIGFFVTQRCQNRTR